MSGGLSNALAEASNLVGYKNTQQYRSYLKGARTYREKVICLTLTLKATNGGPQFKATTWGSRYNILPPVVALTIHYKIRSPMVGSDNIYIF